MNQPGREQNSGGDELLDPRLQQILAEAFGVEAAQVTFTISFAELGYTGDLLESAFLDILLGIQDEFHLGTDLGQLWEEARPRPSPTPGDLQHILQRKAANYGKLFAVPSAKQEQQIASLVDEAIQETELDELLIQHAELYEYPAKPRTPAKVQACLLSLGDGAMDEATQSDESFYQIAAFQQAALAYKYAYLLRDAGVELDNTLTGEITLFIDAVKEHIAQHMNGATESILRFHGEN